MELNAKATLELLRGFAARLAMRFDAEKAADAYAEIGGKWNGAETFKAFELAYMRRMFA